MRALIRPAQLADARAIQAVQAVSWRRAYVGLLPESVFPTAGDAGAINYWREILLRGDTASRVAVADDGAIVGFASGGGRRDPNLPADGEVYALYLAPEAQGQGLGRRLFHGLASVLEARGARALGLWVLAGNAPARGFYAHLGGAPMHRQQTRERGVLFDEIAYVWEPIAHARG